MAASICYLGASTPFGVIKAVEPKVYNPECTVVSRNGSAKTYTLPFLIAHGLKLAK